MPREIHIYRAVAMTIDDAIQKIQRRIRQQACGDSEAGSPQIMSAYCAETGATVGDLSLIFASVPTVDDIQTFAKKIRFAQICSVVDDDHAHWRTITADRSVDMGMNYLEERFEADEAMEKEFVETVGSTMDERHFLVPTMQNIVNDMKKGLPGSLRLLEQLADDREKYPFSAAGNLSNNRLWDTQMLIDKGTVFYAFVMINR